MALVTLIEAIPTDDNGNPVSVRMAGGGSRGYNHKGYTDWLAGLATLPNRKTAIGFDETGWTGVSQPTTLEMIYSAASTSRISRLGKLYWTDARVVVSQGDDSVASPTFVPVVVGTVSSFSVDGADAHLTITDVSSQLDVPTVPATFGGTGGIDGDDAANGRVKRQSLGVVFDVEGQVLNAAYNIYEFGDPAYGFDHFADVRDIGRSGVAPVILAWQGSVQATYNALVAATPPQGGGVFAAGIACVKWWTQPNGPLCADIVASASILSLGDVTAALIGRYPTDILIPQAQIAAANSTRPGAVGLHLDDASENVSAALDRLHLGASSLWSVDGTGTLRLRPWSFDNPILAISCQDISRAAILPPLLARKLGFQKNNRVHAASELAANVSSDDVYYENGTPIEVLKPQEAGANVTEARVSAAFQGQRALATKDNVDFSSGDVANRLAAYLLYGVNGATVQSFKPAEPGANITENRVAAAFQGQRALATRDSVDLNSGDVLNRYAWALAYGNGQNVDSLRPGEAGSNVTETRTASAIAGQGGLATKSQTGYYDINIGDLTSASSDSDSQVYSPPDPFSGSKTSVTGFSGTLNVKPGGMFYFIITAYSGTTSGSNPNAYNSIQILDGGGNVVLDVKIPFGSAPDSRLNSVALLFVNARNYTETLTWRVVTRSDAGAQNYTAAYSQFGNGTVQAIWKAI